jgi:hypothetical protein
VSERSEWKDLSAEELLRKVLNENVTLNENMRTTSARSSELLEKARSWRKRIIELGGEDPGPP